jgi:hypothetical protein
MSTSLRRIADGLATVQQRWPELRPHCDAAPVFVLAAGWRSGSTLLQRLLFPECFVWGEPLGHALPVAGLSEPLRAITPHWPQPHFFYQGEPPDRLAERFVANLYPSMADWVRAQQAWFREWLERPALAAGSPRWGLKEVRLTIDDARYLHWLFPRAKFLFLHRNPFDAWRSFVARRNLGWKWFYRWPDQPLTVELYGRLWREQVSGFVAGHDDVGGLLVRYDDLVAGRLDPIQDYLGFPLNWKALELNPSDAGPRQSADLSADEHDALLREVGDWAERLGYLETPPAPLGTTSLTVSAASAAPSQCVVLVPYTTGIVPACEDGLKQLERRGYPVRRVRGYAAIDQGRNQMVTDALQSGFLETMWIDADIGFDPDAVDRLRAHNLPITCGIYPQKGKRALACHVLPGTPKLVFGNEGGLTEIQYAGTGFLHVRREVYETIQQQLHLPVCNRHFQRPMLPFFQPLIRDHNGEQWYLAEDYAFCHRARHCGYRILADTTLRLSHYGDYGYTWEDAGLDRPRFGTFHYHLGGE